MSEYTPGPWMLGNQPGKPESTWILDSELLTVAMVNDARRKEWKANARLIAAAPDLMVAAKLRLEKGHNDTCAYMLSSVYDCSCGQTELITAIAKAEGREVTA